MTNYDTKNIDIKGDLMDVKKFKQELLNAIETIVNKKLKNLSFDQTYSTVIIKKTRYSVDKYTYTVKIGQNDYTITTKIICSVGDRVRVRIPLNNWSNIYIESKIE